VDTGLASDLSDALIGWWNANLQADTATNCALNEVFVTDLSSATSFTFSNTTGLPSTGTSGGDPLPNNCAHCVSFRTAGRGRSARGRNYVGGLAESASNGSTLNATIIANHINAYLLLIGAGGFVAGLEWVVLSRFHNGVARATALSQPITNVISVDAVMDSQRRRLPGRGT
jgi:hypothetical protein